MSRGLLCGGGGGGGVADGVAECGAAGVIFDALEGTAGFATGKGVTGCDGATFGAGVCEGGGEGEGEGEGSSKTSFAEGPETSVGSDGVA